MPPTPSTFLNGVPELLVLRLLGDREMYGYELVQAIREISAEQLTFAEGVIYPLLHTLERDGALSTRRQTINGRSRVYYSVTPTGRERFDALSAHWRTLTGAIATILEAPRHA
jgi:PadR family transcriptional regulator PadR